MQQEYQDSSDGRDRRGRQGCRDDPSRPDHGSTTGKGEKRDSDSLISTGGGLELFNIRT
ncbi:unnamed protein product, partial [Ectocarpus sp. 6 AP-2014]